MTEKTTSLDRIFTGRILGLEVHRVELANGVRSTREIVRHHGAIAALARLPDGRFVLVRQYRKPMEQELLEVVAGCLEPGEAPADCAVRELKEETGYEVDSLTPLGQLYPTPGYSDEVLHLFFARLRAAAATPAPDEDEKVTVVILTAEQIEDGIRRDEIRDSKTISVWLRARLAGLA